MRRSTALTLAVLALAAVAVPIALPRVIATAGRGRTRDPASISAGLSPGARALVERAFADLDPTKTVDFHVHVVGAGAGGTGARVSPRLLDWWHPRDHLRFLFYLSASGLLDDAQVWAPAETALESADQRYVARLTSLIDTLPAHGRYHLLAFDASYRPDGALDDENTELYTPNAWVASLARARPDLFFPTISVHPYRKDAVAELERWAAEGVRFVKWLPNAMGIDPADPALDPFYRAMAKHDMVLLTHAGEEQAVESERAQRFGNPLLLRRPLDLGVKVIVAHCASLGSSVDFDDPARPELPNFSLFMRLLRDPRYDGKLFGEISALTLSTRLWEPLLTLLRYPEFHRRLVNGSDYPIPAINALIRLRGFAEKTMISRPDMEALRELFEVNPLLFDFVLKRTLSHPETASRFAPTVFLGRPELGPSVTDAWTHTATAAGARTATAAGARTAAP